MDAQSVIDLLDLLERNGLELCIDGGWAVDAVLGEQTRPHEDLDVAIPHKHVSMLRQLLAERGFQEVPRDDTWECNFVLEDNQGHQIDVHSYTLDADGNNVFGVPYIAEHLSGTGHILGRAVRCVPPHWLIKFHTGYEINENDYRDVSALCKKFRIRLPQEYSKFRNTTSTSRRVERP